MEINKQLFEDVLSGKLKGTFVLRNGFMCSSKQLCRQNGAFGFTNGDSWDIVDFIPETNMKENELTIEIPEGKIVDWDESKKQNKIILKDKPLAYEDVCKKLFKKEGYYFVYGDGYIGQGKNFDDDAVRVCPNHATTKHQLECILAKNKLANVAKYLNNGWKPCKNNLGHFDAWVIYVTSGGGCFGWQKIVDCGHYSNVLFKSAELAQQAIEILGEETIKLALEPLGI